MPINPSSLVTNNNKIKLFETGKIPHLFCPKCKEESIFKVQYTFTLDRSVALGQINTERWVVQAEGATGSHHQTSRREHEG